MVAVRIPGDQGTVEASCRSLIAHNPLPTFAISRRVLSDSEESAVSPHKTKGPSQMPGPAEKCGKRTRTDFRRREEGGSFTCCDTQPHPLSISRYPPRGDPEGRRYQ